MKALLIIISGTLLSCGGPKELNDSARVTEKFPSRQLTVVVDGKMSEWGDSMDYDRSTKLIYSISNDSNALYIVIKATDRVQQMKMIRGGIEFWIDPKARKNRTIGIKIPGGISRMEISNNRAGEPDQKLIKQQARLQLLTMELSGFKNEFNGIQDAFSGSQVKVAVDWDTKENMIYELMIPFNTLDPAIISTINNISVGFYIKGVKMEEGTPPRQGPPGGGRPPGVGRSAGNIPDRSQMENMGRDDFFWTKFFIR